MFNLVNTHDCKKELRQADIKVTTARMAVIEFLESLTSPADVSSILKYLKDKNFSTDQATVYRILDLFYKKGIIQRIELGEGKYRYEKSNKHHHHLICSNCGKIEDIEGDFVSDIESQIRKKSGFLVKSHALEFFGICSNCQS